MVIDLHTERERRRLQRQFNPNPVRDAFEHAAGFLAVAAAFGIVLWVILTSQPRG